MKPPPERVLTVAAERLERLGLGSPAMAADLTRIADVLRVLAREWDAAAASRLEAITELEDLIDRGHQMLPALADGHGNETGTRSADLRATDLRIAALDRRLDNLRATVIVLEAALEGCDFPGAARLLDELRGWELGDARRRTVMDRSW